MAVARYYDKEKAAGQFFPGVPARDLTEEEYDALPEWLQRSVDATKGPSAGMYRKSKPKGWKAPTIEAAIVTAEKMAFAEEPEPTPEPTPAPEGEEE